MSHSFPTPRPSGCLLRFPWPGPWLFAAVSDEPLGQLTGDELSNSDDNGQHDHDCRGIAPFKLDHGLVKRESQSSCTYHADNRRPTEIDFPLEDQRTEIDR